MEYVIFSDIHGNAKALCEMMKSELNGCNRRFIFCGDICGYYYEAEECVRLLERIPGLMIVRGNHDQYYLDAYYDYDFTEKLVQKYGSSYRIKNETVYSYINNLPERLQLNIAGRKVYVQHGSYSNSLEGRVYPNTELENLTTDAVYIFGHTHYQMYRRKDNCIYINPGSLGQPRDGIGFAYCVLDDEFKATFHRVELDVNELVQEVRIKDPDNMYLEEVLYRNL